MQPIAVAYLVGIGLNVVALGYALAQGQVLYALAFCLVIVYLAARFRMLSKA